MGDKSAIEWTEATWNPVAGCSKVSPGCAHCYAETISLRFRRSLKRWTPENAAENVVLHPERLDQPLRWRRPRMIFVNSMSDLFHEFVPDEFIRDVFETMAQASQHTFQVLTKRPERALEWFDQQSSAGRHVSEWGRPRPNVWLGVSIENARYAGRADVLREIPAAVRFISAEPLLGSLYPAVETETRKRLNLDKIDWLIVGGESGAHARPMQIEWAREIRDACRDAGVKFFFKQWGGKTSKSGGRELDGEVYDEMPIAASG